MKAGDKVYFKPWNCLLDIRCTRGIRIKEVYQQFENIPHELTCIYKDSIEANIEDFWSWNWGKEVVDINRKVI